MEVSLAITILLYSAVFLLTLILMLLFRINQRLSYIAFQFRKNKQSSSNSALLTDFAIDSSEEITTKPIKSSGSNFARFLKEDPQRLTLPKKEQFIAYRKWRKDKGLNWHSRD